MGDEQAVQVQPVGRLCAAVGDGDPLWEIGQLERGMGSGRRTGVLLCGVSAGCKSLGSGAPCLPAPLDENQEGIEPTWQVVAKRIVQGQLGLTIR